MKRTPRQCNNIQVNNSNEKNQQIYSVTTANNISAQHKYVKVILNGIPIEMLVECGSNATIVTVEAFIKIIF